MKKSFSLKHIIYLLIAIILLLVIFIITSLYTQKEYQKELKKTQNELEILQKNIQKIKSQIDSPFLEYNMHIPSEIADYNKAIIVPPKEENKSTFIIEENILNVKPKENNITKKSAEVVKKNVLPFKSNITKETKVILPPQKTKKPKLVIIIDDVSFKWQVNKIKAIPFKITPSFFPPSKRHPNTPIYAKTFSHYMVHLPLEAIHFPTPEPHTLNTKDSYQTILKRVEYVKNLFPKAKFINNHTGSTFTSDKESMIKLFKALKNENLGFV
ncbi:MAG TPA: divergent polysaccharide deacetylase family protein, partial [Nautiliaceae bacterium]|nr:divergent polysaccharide deacetylase family protein [Nautiliaceae bacterium]